jgi:hypothetical protein
MGAFRHTGKQLKLSGFGISEQRIDRPDAVAKLFGDCFGRLPINDNRSNRFILFLAWRHGLLKILE